MLLVVGMVLVFVGLLGLVTQSFALSCPPGGTYSAKASGYVLRSDGTGLGSASVTLTDVAAGTNLGSSLTSTSGAYAIPFTAGNGKDYRLTANKVGFETTAAVFSSACTKEIAGYPMPIVFTQNIVMKAVPPATPVVAGFTWLSDGLFVAFSDASTGGPDVWAWSFGDGSTVRTGSISTAHQYAAAGTYNVTMTATRSVDGATDTDSAAISLTVSGGTTKGTSNEPPPAEPPKDADTNVTDAGGNPVDITSPGGDALLLPETSMVLLFVGVVLVLVAAVARGI